MQPFGKKGLRAGVLAATLGIAALGGSLATASSALAAVPGGVACQPGDGKVEGSGSTYQTNAQALFWTNYNQDICGNVASDTIAGQNMGAYNWATGGGIPSGDTGSGAGLISADCRGADYWGSDLPYTQAQLNDLGSAAGTGAGTTGVFGKNCPALYTTFAPDATTDGSSLPYSGDTGVATPLSFPTAGSSVAVMINLTAAVCGGTKPSAINLTGAQIALIEGGSVANWNDARLRTNGNAGLAACNEPITRVVRFDNSGTTNIFKQYLNDTTSNGATCTGNTWSTYYGGSTNNAWPQGGSCADGAVVTDGINGGPALLTKLQGTTGGIGYADLSDAVTDTTGLITAKVQNAAATAYTSPQLGSGANCTYAGISEPNSGDPTAMVGLDAGDDWANDNQSANGAPNHWDSTNEGSLYPICGLTFDIVYPLASTPTTISSATADQARTLYTYFRYVESIGQSLLPNNLYAALPDAVTGPILQGINLNY